MLEQKLTVTTVDNSESLEFWGMCPLVAWQCIVTLCFEIIQCSTVKDKEFIEPVSVQNCITICKSLITCFLKKCYLLS